MIKSIDPVECDGCGICVESCPVDVIALQELGAPWERVGPKGWKAVIRFPNECHSCRLCAIDCHVDAIDVTHGIRIPDPFLAYERLAL